MGVTRVLKVACVAVALSVATAISSSAQTFTRLASFNSTNGANPSQALIQGLDGNLYGTAAGGGIVNSSYCQNGCGTFFKITPTGALSLLYIFCSQANCIDGQEPVGALVLGSTGEFYGTTLGGGANGQGTVFKISSAGKLTTLYNFCSQARCADGNFPEAGLLLASNGNFYGTTANGGTYGFGTIFEITPQGDLTTLYNFCSLGPTCGQFPESGLIQASNGNFYGMTPLGGKYDWGTIFEMTEQNQFTALRAFVNDYHGGNPRSGLVEGPDENLYGTTLIGGYFVTCESGCGTIFKLTLTGQLTTLHAFCHAAFCPDGANPYASPTLATDGNLYGSTEAGGASWSHCIGCGTLFEITPQGKLTTIHLFCSETNCADGLGPIAPLVQATDGNFYGTTYAGGSSNACRGACGTIFKLSTGLTPFVKTVTTSGLVGANVVILGNNLTGTTSVAFNGTAAAFTVISATEITATVPAGATTGTVSVKTPSSTLNSQAPFQVPQ